MSRYKMPEVLGGGEFEEHPRGTPTAAEAPSGTVAFLINGCLVCVAAGLLTAVKPPLPEEPPVGSFVLVTVQSKVLHRRNDAGIDWWDYLGKCWLTWAQVCELGTPVRLVPAPEPVELPWAYHRDSKSIVIVRLGSINSSCPVRIDTRDDYEYVSADAAREMARALNTAADKAEAEATS